MPIITTPKATVPEEMSAVGEPQYAQLSFAHGLDREEVMKVIDKAIASAGPTTYQLQLIHGYNRGRTRSSGPRFCADRSGA